jgi:hypothetical protein
MLHELKSKRKPLGFERRQREIRGEKEIALNTRLPPLHYSLYHNRRSSNANPNQEHKHQAYSALVSNSKEEKPAITIGQCFL